MLTTLFTYLIFISASFFAGLALFLATVLRRVFNDLPEAAYLGTFCRLIRFGRKSLLINTLLIVPTLAMFVYIFVAKPVDSLFVFGGVLYVLGSLTVSRFVNEPLYTRLLAKQSADLESIADLRRQINRANIIRAVLSTLGVVVMAVALMSDIV